jgi:hypothetical protein
MWEVEGEERASLARAYRTILGRVADFSDRVDAARADRLRIRAAREVDWNAIEQRHAALREGLETVAAAFDAIATWLGGPESRCAWARAHVDLRFDRIDRELEYRSWLADMNGFYAEDTITAEDEAQMDAMEQIARSIPPLANTWRRDPAGTAERIRAYTPPRNDTAVQPDWDAIRAALDAVTGCGW